MNILDSEPAVVRAAVGPGNILEDVMHRFDRDVIQKDRITIP